MLVLISLAQTLMAIPELMPTYEHDDNIVLTQYWEQKNTNSNTSPAMLAADVTNIGLHMAYYGPFIATQLNSTRRRVELSGVDERSIATPTQLNSTQLD